jgi:hypothetical protein
MLHGDSVLRRRGADTSLDNVVRHRPFFVPPDNGVNPRGGSDEPGDGAGGGALEGAGRAGGGAARRP